LVLQVPHCQLRFHVFILIMTDFLIHSLLNRSLEGLLGLRIKSIKILKSFEISGVSPSTEDPYQMHRSPDQTGLGLLVRPK
jgi:hypothetical protein